MCLYAYMWKDTHTYIWYTPLYATCFFFLANSINIFAINKNTKIYEILSILLEKKIQNQTYLYFKDKSGWHNLYDYNHHDYLSLSGIPVDVRDERGNTLLIVACQNGNKVKDGTI